MPASNGSIMQARPSGYGIAPQARPYGPLRAVCAKSSGRVRKDTLLRGKPGERRSRLAPAPFHATTTNAKRQRAGLQSELSRARAVAIRNGRRLNGRRSPRAWMWLARPRHMRTSCILIPKRDWSNGPARSRGKQIVSSVVEHSFAIRSVAGSSPVRSSQDEKAKVWSDCM